MKITIFIVLIILCFFLPACGPVDHTYTVNGVAVDRKKQDLKRIENILTEWVISRSNRISSSTARKIVGGIMRADYPLLMLAIIDVESNFVPTAVSKQGAWGLTQVMPKVHGQRLIKANVIAVERDLFDIDASIRSGNLILRDCLKQSNGNVEKALERYLGGIDGIYVKKILVNLSNLYVLTR
ncbi:MAG: Lytic transglycosylase catalytic [Promethearchaeota archaeon CR_4]|nr:MAG: Lytic transglycosylase catalytic [Candidatus Lokiarchaeota archaeon CR_4]